MPFLFPELKRSYDEARPVLNGREFLTLRKLHRKCCNAGTHVADPKTVIVYSNGLIADCVWCRQPFPFCPNFL